MIEYANALKHILENGITQTNRTGIDTIGVFGYQMRFDLSRGFPAITTKKLAWKSVVSELLWFIEGSMDERRLAEILYDANREDLTKVGTIWTANANNQGKALGYINTDTSKMLGPIYGFQWRNFNGSMYNSAPKYGGVDQLSWLIDEITNNPDSRRLILSAWNPQQINQMALPPCHVLAQFRVTNNKLSCQLYQRSADMFLGVPFNIASYALLTHIIAKICGLEVGDFIWVGGDCHIYVNHLEQVKEQLSRDEFPLPKLVLPDLFDIHSILRSKTVDYILENYIHHDSIKAPMAV